MATTLFFDGRLSAVPQVVSKVDASGLAALGLGAVGRVALIGTAVGGRPSTANMSLNDFLVVNSPAAARTLFRSGNIAEAIPMVFNPSNDAAIPAGATDIIVMKVNQAVQGSATLAGAIGDAITVTAEDYGEFTNQINVAVATGTTAGTKSTTVVFETTTQTGDNIGLVDSSNTARETAMFQLNYSPFSGGDGSWEAMTADVLPTGVVRAYGTRTDAGLESEVSDPDAGGALPDVLEVVSNGADTRVVKVYGLDGSNNPIVESFQLNGATQVTGAVTFTRVLCATVDSASGTRTVTVREATTNTTALTIGTSVTEAGCVVPQAMYVAGETVAVTTDVAAPNHDGATATADILIEGLSISGAVQRERIQVNGTDVIRGTATWSRIDLIALGDIDSDAPANVSVFATAAKTSTTQDTLTKVRDHFNARQVDESGTTRGFVLTLRTPQVSLAPSKLDWTSTPSNIYDNATATGFSAIANALEEFYDTSSDLVDAARVAATYKVYTLTITAVNNGDDHILTFDGTTAVTYTDDATPTLAEAASGLATLINDHPTLRQQMVATTSGASGEILTITMSTLRAAGGVNAVYSQTGSAAATLVLTTAQAGDGGAPSNTTPGSPVFLANGAEGTAAQADWDNALANLERIDVNTIVALTGDPSVHAAVSAHCARMAGVGKSERDAIVGLSALDSNSEPTNVLPNKASIKAQIADLNTRHVRACAQSIERFNIAGTRTTFLPWFQAAVAAGMQAGSPIGTPLTRKNLNVLGIVQDSSWNPSQDAHELIQAGLWFAEEHRTGIRNVRNVTTWVTDNNLAFVEASVNEAANFAVFNLRNSLEFAVGEPGFAGTVESVKNTARQLLNTLVEEQTIVAWQSLTVSLNGDVMTVSVEISPPIPVNFIPVTVYLTAASFTA